MQNINKHILGDYVLDSYEYYTEWSQESQNYIAKVIEFPMLSATGETKDLALAEIKIIVNSTIESLLNSGKPVPEAIKTKNYSGKLRISIPGDLHRYLIMEAAIRNTSIDNVILHKLISDMSEEDKKHYLLQMEKKVKPKKETEISKLQKMIRLPEKILRFIRRIHANDQKLFIEIRDKITKIAMDTTNDYETKIKAIKKLQENLPRKRKSGIQYNNQNLEKVLLLIFENPGINRKEVQYILQIEKKTAMRNLKKLIEKDLIIANTYNQKYVYNISEKGSLEVKNLQKAKKNKAK